MRLIDADDFFERMKNDTDLCAEMEMCGEEALKKYLDLQPTAYDVDKVVEELKETMQDLSVIEILSHIDFDSTIQSGLDNFLKAYNSELLRIVRQGGKKIKVVE